MTSTTDSGSTSTDDTGTHPTSTGTAQQPAMSAAMVATWLAKGDYKSWACEPAVHEARSPSPHGFNRICSNDVLSAAAGSTEPFPEGAAAVKELYASVTGTTPVGYAVYSKTKADSEGGAAWYWYEIIPTDSMAAPHDKTGLVADGLGDGGPAKMICVGCHAAAGSDAAHTPTVGGHDQVYTPVSASSNIDGG
ncbi:MAG TPA: hypothetical protein VH062_03140 [Polyangiaceae bacterium]|nr:hypothetical protein [Polyangiaceae bacterium]